MAVITISAAGGNWNSTATWVGGVIPTTTDSILGDATSGQLTVNVSASIQFADFTNYTQTLTINGQFTLNLAGATTTFGSGMNFAGTQGIVCNVNHTFVQNTTNRIPILFFGAGTKTLSTDLYITNFTSSSTTGLCNGSNLNIYGNATFSSGRFAGTSEFVLAGTGTFTGGILTNQIGKLTVDTTGTITTSNSIILYSNSTFKYIKGTVNFTSSAYNGRMIWSYGLAGNTNTIILNTGQTFNFLLSKNNTSTVSPLTYNIQAYSGTSVELGNVNIFNTSVGILFHSITTDSGTTINMDKLFINCNNGSLSNSSTPSSLTLQTNRTFNVNNIYGLMDNLSSNDGVPSTSSFVLQSSTASGSTFLNLVDGTKSSLSFINFTDVDASGGNTIKTLEGILTRTTNIVSTLTTGGGGQTAYTFFS